jgi:hypothetical protein
MGLILSEPIKKVVEILKILTKMSVEDAKIHPKRPCLSAFRKPKSSQKHAILGSGSFWLLSLVAC